VQGNNVDDFPHVRKNTSFQRQRENVSKRFAQNASDSLQVGCRDLVGAGGFLLVERKKKAKDLAMGDFDRAQEGCRSGSIVLDIMSSRYLEVGLGGKLGLEREALSRSVT